MLQKLAFNTVLMQELELAKPHRACLPLWKGCGPLLLLPSSPQRSCLPTQRKVLGFPFHESTASPNVSLPKEAAGSGRVQEVAP